MNDKTTEAMRALTEAKPPYYEAPMTEEQFADFQNRTVIVKDGIVYESAPISSTHAPIYF